METQLAVASENKKVERKELMMVARLVFEMVRLLGTEMVARTVSLKVARLVLRKVVMMDKRTVGLTVLMKAGKMAFQWAA